MPIRFRCSYCNRLLGIATRKAGMQTTCPHCAKTISVPVPKEDDGKTERLNLEDIDALLGKPAGVVTSFATNTSSAAAPTGSAVMPPLPKPPEAAHTEPAPDPAEPEPPVKSRTAPPPLPKVPAKPANPDDPPLFEGDVDEILGAKAATEEPSRPRPPATTGMDAMSLSEPPRMLVISAHKATLLMALVVVLMALSFAAGYFLAPK